MYIINTKESLKHVVVKLRELSLANRKRDDKARVQSVLPSVRLFGWRYGRTAQC